LAKWAQLSNSCPICRCIITTQKCIQSTLFKAKVLSKSHCFASALLKIQKAQSTVPDIILCAMEQIQSWTEEEQTKFINALTKNMYMEIKNATYEITYDFLQNSRHLQLQKSISILGLLIKRNGFISTTRLCRSILLRRIGKFEESIKDLNVILRMEPRNKVVLKRKQSALLKKNKARLIKNW
jgi:hypothetical protein